MHIDCYRGIFPHVAIYNKYRRCWRGENRIYVKYLNWEKTQCNKQHLFNINNDFKQTQAWFLVMSGHVFGIMCHCNPGRTRMKIQNHCDHSNWQLHCLYEFPVKLLLEMTQRTIVIGMLTIPLFLPAVCMCVWVRSRLRKKMYVE